MSHVRCNPERLKFAKLSSALSRVYRILTQTCTCHVCVMPRIASTLSILTVEAKSYEFLDYEVNLCCPLSDIQVHAVMQSPFV